MVHTLGGLGHPEITRGSMIPTTLWVSHRSFGDMGGEKWLPGQLDVVPGATLFVVLLR